MLRILFAIPSLDRGGPDRVFFEMLRAVDRTKFAPSLLVGTRGGYYESRLPKDVPVVALVRPHRSAPSYPMWAAVREIGRQLPDVVLATLRMNLTLGLFAKLLPKATRLVLRQANDFSSDFAYLAQRSFLKHRLARGLTSAALAQADAIVCQSSSMYSELRTLLGPEAHLRRIPNPIDVGDVLRQASAASVELVGDPSLVSVGRLMPQKGFDILLPAIALIARRFPAMHLTIFGEGPERGKLQAMQRELKLESTVTFAGYESRVLSAVRCADLFVLASRYEGLPNSALEALACGTPVVLTDCPGANREIVRIGHNGRLAPSTQVADVATAIAQALEERSGYDRDAISSDVDGRFSPKVVMPAYEGLFEEVVSNGPR